ncbi:hypothetical protein SBV1_1740012 [Verrucomicrobia bacterium]|nr:hypothetical protein SBV1_1740012 [Verrucomicrobiota bacterium]
MCASAIIGNVFPDLARAFKHAKRGSPKGRTVRATRSSPLVLLVRSCSDTLPDSHN